MNASYHQPRREGTNLVSRRAAQFLSQQSEQNLLRQRTALRVLDATHVDIAGRSFVNFASNNYLGLTHHPRVQHAVADALRNCGAGSGGAGLITGHSLLHQECEAKIAQWKGTESAILFPSGYQANLAAIQMLAVIGEKVRFIIDKLVHASLIDAVRATGKEFRVFPHNDMAKLRRLLERAEPDELQIVISETIFSMDGDSADLQGLRTLKESFEFVLLLDEAHASGVYGPNGQGLLAEMGMHGLADVNVTTFSKAMGLAGGAICASKLLCDAVMNGSRAFIFSTSVPPPVVAGIAAAIDVVIDEPVARCRVRELSRDVRTRLKREGFELPPGDSPIIPLIVGDEQKAVELAAHLRDNGLLAVAVRPPTVAPGTSRVRITLNGGHTNEEIEQLFYALKRL